jgi:CheY-like chemotaxis protein
MLHNCAGGPSGERPAGAPPVLTALVVDDSFGARARITTLLELGGWRVHQAVGTEDALRLATVIGPGLVVTDMVMRNGHGATLMRQLREGRGGPRCGERPARARRGRVPELRHRAGPRRGVVAHGRLVTLVDLCVQVDQRGRPLTVQATRSA